MVAWYAAILSAGRRASTFTWSFTVIEVEGPRCILEHTLVAYIFSAVPGFMCRNEIVDTTNTQVAHPELTVLWAEHKKSSCTESRHMVVEYVRHLKG